MSSPMTNWSDIEAIKLTQAEKDVFSPKTNIIHNENTANGGDEPSSQSSAGTSSELARRRFFGDENEPANSLPASDEDTKFVNLVATIDPNSMEIPRDLIIDEAKRVITAATDLQKLKPALLPLMDLLKAKNPQIYFQNLQPELKLNNAISAETPNAVVNDSSIIVTNDPIVGNFIGQSIVGTSAATNDTGTTAAYSMTGHPTVTMTTNIIRTIAPNSTNNSDVYGSQKSDETQATEWAVLQSTLRNNQHEIVETLRCAEDAEVIDLPTITPDVTVHDLVALGPAGYVFYNLEVPQPDAMETDIVVNAIQDIPVSLENNQVGIENHLMRHQPSTSLMHTLRKITQEDLDLFKSKVANQTAGVQFDWSDRHIQKLAIEFLFPRLFSKTEILHGTPSGRKCKSSGGSTCAYNEQKICELARFTAWLISKPKSNEMFFKNFQQFEKKAEEANRTGLSKEDKKFFDTITSHCSSRLRNKYELEANKTEKNKPKKQKSAKAKPKNNKSGERKAKKERNLKL